MDPIKIEATAKTPEISFDADKGLLEMKGRSIPEHTVEFYKPLHQWIDEYGENPQPLTSVEIFVEYYNTSSSKSILDMFKRLESIHKKGHDMIVKWYYEDDDEALLESGEEYQSMVDIPFELISIPVEDDEDDE